MKKILRVIAYALALNFLAVIGGVGALWRSGHLDHERITSIKALLFPPPVALDTASTTQPSDGAATRPSSQLDELLAKASGRSAEQQVEFLSQSYDSRMGQLDMRARELSDRQTEIDSAKQALTSDRAALEAEKKKVAAQEQQAAVQAGDQGFQDSLTLYSNLPAKQVKTIFMTLSDDTLVRYLQAMPSRTAAKILKEFKTPDEIARTTKVMELMRLASQKPAPQTQPSDGSTPGSTAAVNGP